VSKESTLEIWEVSQGSSYRRVFRRPTVLAVLDDYARVDRCQYRDPNYRVNGD
jgi:hypothetical protein